jgi:hypothetical protein
MFVEGILRIQKWFDNCLSFNEDISAFFCLETVLAIFFKFGQIFLNILVTLLLFDQTVFKPA